MFKKRRIKNLKKLQQRYRQEADQKAHDLNYGAYLISMSERKKIESEHKALEAKIEALDVLIDDLYVQLNGKVRLD